MIELLATYWFDILMGIAFFYGLIEMLIFRKSFFF